MITYENWKFLGATRLYWEVAAVSPDNQFSWSEARSFRIAGEALSLNIKAGQENVPVTWIVKAKAEFAEIDGIELELSRDSLMGNLEIYYQSKGPDFLENKLVKPIEILPSTRYFISVLGLRRNYEWVWNNTSRFQEKVFLGWYHPTIPSIPISFTTAPAPQLPPVQLPMSIRSFDPSSLTADVYWLPQRGATSYTLQIAYDSAFTTGLQTKQGFVYNDWKFLEDPDKDTVLYQFTGLTPGQTYHWRIKSIFPGGETSWSPSMDSTTTPYLEIVSVDYPLNNEKVLPRPISFSWKRVPDATRYWLNVARFLTGPEIGTGMPFFATEVSPKLTETQFKWNGLGSGSIWRWTVKAGDAMIWGSYAPNINFQTATLAEDSVLQNVPPIRPGLEWTYAWKSQSSAVNPGDPANPSASDESGEIGIRILATEFRNDTLFFTAHVSESGTRILNGNTEPYVRNRDIPFLISNTRLMTWHEASKTWGDTSVPFFSRRDAIRGKQRKVWLEGKQAGLFELNTGTYPSGPAYAFFTYLENRGLISWDGGYNTGVSLTSMRYSSLRLLEYGGLPFDTLSFQSGPTRTLNPDAVPTPAVPRDFLHLSSYLDGLNGLVQATLFDLRGQALITGTSGREFKTPPARQGLYLLRVQTAAGTRTHLLMK